MDGAPIVVLVHGSMDRSSAFARCCRHLRDLHTIRYDRRGYGKSVDAGTVDIAGHADDLLEILDERPASVVGHSLGGVIALTAAQRRPDLVRSVGAYEAPMPWVEWWPSRSAGGDATLAAEGQSDDAIAAAAERFMRRMIGDARWDALPDGSRAARRAEGRALLAELRSARRAAPYDPTTITTPVITGHSTRSKDHHRWAAQELARLVGGPEPFVIDGADHGAHATHHEEFARFVRDVVTRAQ